MTDTRTSASGESGVSLPPGKSMIYVVDDDYDVRTSLRFLLETEGFDVRTFRSAVALLASSTRNRADCLVVGLQDGGTRRTGTGPPSAKAPGRRDIGDYLGMTLETVSRALSQLSDQGVWYFRAPVKSCCATTSGWQTWTHESISGPTRCRKEGSAR
ncbi:helix-turn-helix domain-containing protein [Bradyrhizobium sp. AZCC 1678]|uniref:helix-turn-helix domain-containing protein n=1 Tax=Bradyrhizobium sp. AZCC 1678 TaxID=3117030 RepID=UPI003FA54E97